MRKRAARVGLEQGDVVVEDSSNEGRQPLTRTLILETGIEIADAEGIDAVTMRRVGAALGVQAMSLYNHVASKRDLLDGMAAHLIASLGRSGSPSLHWKDVSRQVSQAYRRLGLDHPALFPYVIERPFGDAESLDALEGMFGIFRRDGFSPRATYLVFLTLTSFVEGFTLDEITRRTLTGFHDAVRNPMLSDDLASAHPVVFEVYDQGKVDNDAAFERCLEVVLDAIESLRATA